MTAPTFVRRRLARALGLMLITAPASGLVGCGGGGGSSSTPVPTQPPSFTSAATASVVENVTGAFYTLTATDPRGRGLTFSIASGADATAFTLSGSQLSFASSPNFDQPADADGNNVYQVQLQVSDGQSTARLDLVVTITNSREGIAVRRIGSGFVDPIAIAAMPGEARLLIAERGGAIYYFDPTTGTRTLFASISVSTEGERGLRALAFPFDYQTANFRFFFVLISDPQTGRVSIRYCVPPSNGNTSCQPIASAGHQAITNYGGYIGYGADRRLYAVTADGAGTGAIAQDDASILGKLIRIDPVEDPYAGAAGGFFRYEIVAKGFRDPRGGTLLNGQLLIADRGETRDEINLFTTAGSNYGWPLREGVTDRLPPVPAGLVNPVIDYARVSGGGVVAGVVYRGAVSSLRDFYVFADESGAIYSIAGSRLTQGTTLGLSATDLRTADFAPDSGSLGAPVVFGEDGQGELYIANRAGEIFKVVAN